jgi:hypothetical protein
MIVAATVVLAVGVYFAKDADAQRSTTYGGQGGGGPAPMAAPRWEYATLRFDVTHGDWVWTTQDEVKRGEKPRLFKQMGGYGREADHEISIVDLATQAGTYGWELTSVLERDKGGTEAWFRRPLR